MFTSDTRSADVLREFGEAQRGHMARWQLRTAGLSDSWITRASHRGWLVVRHHGVFGLPASEQIPLAREATAILAGGPGAVLSHHSAAVLWRLRPCAAAPVHVTVSGGRRGPVYAVGVLAHRSDTIAPVDVEIHEGLPVTSTARTLLDVAASLPDRDVERLLDEGLFVRRQVLRFVEDQIRSRALETVALLSRSLTRAGERTGAGGRTSDE